ncbi:MAG: amidase [Oscillospiraceae bacterium]|nr:amidase [Oscillospiraceae bacterium]
MKEFFAMTATELSAAIKKKEISPVEVMESTIARIQRRNPSLNAIVYTDFDYAMDRARELEKAIMSGQQMGDLCGIPTALKDFLPGKKGWPGTSGGVKCLAGTPDPVNSTYTKAVEGQHGIVIGKTNSPTFAFRGLCDNYLYGPTGNPFDITRNSGGSSGGAAAAVADGLLPIAEGTDGGGSIRIPAAWCGIYGFKASIGTIPSPARPNAWAETHPYCFAGVLSRTVEDTALVLNHMAYYDPRDINSLPQPKRDFREIIKRPIKGMKIAYTPNFGVFSVDPEIEALTRAAAMRFAEAGAVVEEIDFRFNYTENELADCWLEQVMLNFLDVLEGMKAGGMDLIKDHADDLPPQIIAQVEKARRGDYLTYAATDNIRTHVFDVMLDAFEKYDLILAPTVSCEPVKNASDGNTMGPETINGNRVDRLIGFCPTFFSNMIGTPAASVPAGLTKNGLPVGLQIVGRRFCDEDVLRASAAFQQIQPWAHFYEIVERRPLEK